MRFVRLQNHQVALVSNTIYFLIKILPEKWLNLILLKFMVKNGKGYFLKLKK